MRADSSLTRLPRARLPAALLALALIAAACSTSGGSGKPADSSWTIAPPAPATASPATPALAWHACNGGECATLPVALDAAHPDGRHIDLALLRVPARNKAARIGSLLVNPGGPGASGVDLARGLTGQLPSRLRDRFDIVGWDPRGTAASAPIDCGRNLDYLFSGNTSPRTPAEQDALDAVSKKFADDCEAHSGDELPFISSTATVSDMDQIRAALGEDKLTYLGYSYGTYLGALYAQTFPNRVRAFVLDGAVDPSLSADQSVIQQAQGLELGLNDFLADCAKNSDCEFRNPNGDNTVAGLKNAYDALRAKLEGETIKASLQGRPRVLTPAEVDLGVAGALYSQELWPDLSDALAKIQSGDARPLIRLFDDYIQRNDDGTYATDWPAFLAISCLDGPPLGDAAAFARLEALAAQAAPRFGAANVGLGLPCAYWPVAPENAVGAPVHAPTSAPIVVVGTTGDPVTPVAWARSLAQQLGSGHLIVNEGQGHTSFPANDHCLDDAVTDYLIDLVVPPPDLHCGTPPATSGTTGIGSVS